ncbi:pantoate--beta-alanine ligase [Candidatus Thermokryptus mobilis]|uniref:Pantothenate synthetase n=1 Tax=Candidatus Thermokryptus mobilis TaxID=1643428 RepID=A0A0S4MZG3_9BACT|nr:pantoate--beta-alanine ligase [Candidatus Thermokryptus mobilis]CUU03366.1 pantoate--beta-alanine ligase [Candidatus Thermokryptus mobilis]
MRIISKIKEMQRVADDLRREGKIIGVVPTMGYLHEGHLSLIRLAKERSDVVITTIFVNPLQFAPNEDYERYPRDFERDVKLAQSAGCDIIFHPSVEEMYPKNFLTYVEVDKLTKVLEGEFRPTHFRGVTTVVAKLFNITKPHIAIFGQKDAQQALIIKQMVRDLNFDIEIIVAPIVREPDGLAMSSRNVYLSDLERKDATVLYESLKLAEKLIKENGERDPNVIISKMKELISSKPTAKIDYIAIVEPETLEKVESLTEGHEYLVALAVRIGSTRLIDNTIVKV